MQVTCLFQDVDEVFLPVNNIPDLAISIELHPDVFFLDNEDRDGIVPVECGMPSCLIPFAIFDERSFYLCENLRALAPRAPLGKI